MALQVTPNVGGTTATVPIDPTAPPPVTSNSLPPVPQYRMDFAGITRSASVGLSIPTSVGDFEIAFSRIAADLKDALNVLGDANRATISQTRRVELSQALAAFEQMAIWGQQVDDNLANVERQGNIITAETTRRTDAETAKGTLTTQRNGLQEQINRNNTNIFTLNSDITNLRNTDSALLTERARLNPTTSAAQIAQIDLRRSQISTDIATLNSQIFSLTQSNLGLQTQINDLNTRIGTLDATINDATDKINAAEKSRTDSRRIIDRTRSEMALFYDATIIATKLAMGKLASDMAADAGMVEPLGGQFDRLIQTLAAAVVNIGALLSASAVGKEVAAGEGAGAGLNLDVSAPGRFGQPNATVARALAFAGIVAGVLGAVADLLNAVRQGLGMQTAESFANAGAPRVRVGL